MMILNSTPAVDPKISTTSEQVSRTASPMSHSGAPHVVFSSTLIKQRLGSRANLRKLANHDCSVCVGSESIQPATVVRDLGAYLDAELTMNQHVSKIAAASFFHLRCLRQIRRRVGTEVTSGSYLHLSHPDSTIATRC